MVLRWSPHVQQRKIAEMLGQTEASISRQIKLLHGMALLQTVRPPENRREHITTLTTKGERFCDEAMTILNNYHSPVFARLSEKQQAAMIESLQLMHTETCSADKPASCHHMFEEA